MKKIFQIYHILFLSFLILITTGLESIASPFYHPDGDSTQNKKSDTSGSLIWPLRDYTNSYFDDSYHPIDFNNPSNFNTTIEYDPIEKRYYFYYKIGNQHYKLPTFLTPEEYMRYKSKKDEELYWKKRAQTLDLFSDQVTLPTMYKDNSMFDRLFGGQGFEVRPQGNIDLSFGGLWQRTLNPALTAKQQGYGIPDFDVQMNLGLIAKVGDKVKLNFNYNTKATFDFNNQMKLNYVGKEDEIIKSIDLGYTNFTLPTKLIRGVQSLFGIKTQLKFGRLTLTSIISQQKSQKQTLNIQGGAQRQEFEVNAMDYDENRHFLLGGYFHDNYDKALKDFPVINSLVNINRIEVWITNKNSTTNDTREIIGFMDLAESKPYLPQFNTNGSVVPDNNSNSLYTQLVQTPAARISSSAINTLKAMGLQENQDFNKVLARKLNPSEYYFDPQIGYLSLNQTLQSDQVLAVAYQYTFNGKVYQVGEFAQSVTPDSAQNQVLYLKMLKATQLNTTIPIWDLMMKNVYNIGGFGINKENFVLNLMYQEPGKSFLRYLPEGPAKGIALIQVLNLDKLNNQNDPQPDGLFDFVENRTIFPKSGRVIFPVLEPFGKGLYEGLGNDPQLISEYAFPMLYDSTKFVAQQYANQNRFYLKGNFKSSSSSEIFLGGFNIPQGSVTIQAGGQTLIENLDFTIDYSIGKVNILNQNLISSGVPITVQFENNTTFGFQQQSLFGTRADYYVNDHLNLGATYMRMKERPFTTKVDLGDDPINNRAIGLDFNYQKESKRLTKWIDKLPFISTNAPSMIVAAGEGAKLIPGQNKLIDIDQGGTVYLDNFEGTRSSFDLRYPFNAWALASTPSQAINPSNQVMFPESELDNNLDYNKNRAKLLWYNLDPTLVDGSNSTPEHLRTDLSELSKPYARIIKQQEVFPPKQNLNTNSNLITFDLTYFPKTRGPYNFNTTNLNSNGQLNNPEAKWGGIMRAIDYNNFEASNIEYIEMWVLDPYSSVNPNNTGDLYINLGNVSEDILKDSRKMYENGMPYPADPNQLQVSNWGNTPLNAQQLTNAFDNDPSAREFQDIGLDGMLDNQEQTKFKNYISQVQTLAPGTDLANSIGEDPSGDNFRHFRDNFYTINKSGVLERYSKYNNTQGNSAVASATSTYAQSSTNLPDAEDLNRDNTLNESEEYYQYRIHIEPDMQIGQNYIVGIQNSNVKLPNDSTIVAKWYQFKIPIKSYEQKVGNLNDFRSIRFVRMYMTGFTDTMFLRMARLDLTRSQWRKYSFNLEDHNAYTPISNIPFVVGSVSLEENSNSKPVGYVMPPRIQRQLQQAATGVNLQQNEQSLALYLCDLKDSESRGVFKEFGVDIRQYKTMRMYIHAQNVPDQKPVNKDEVEAFIRIGSDMTNNYYEYTIPLTITPDNATDPNVVWPEANEMNLDLSEFIQAKSQRDQIAFPVNEVYRQSAANGRTISVIGSPNFAQTKNILLGVRNKYDGNNDTKCVTVWFNELRMSDIINNGGYAATGQLDVQLADLGSVSLSGLMHTPGYGNIDQKINQRYQDNLKSFTINSNLNLGKFFPEKWGVQWPLFVGTNQTYSSPKYDPYDMDVLFKNKLAYAPNDSARNAMKEAARTVNKINTLSMQGIKIVPTGQTKKRIYSISNFDFGYSNTNNIYSDPLLELNNLRQQKWNFGYNFDYKPLYLYPFKNIFGKKFKSKFIKDFNLNLLPNSFNFSTNMFRQQGETKVRDLGNDGLVIPITYNKFWTWNRVYGLRWDIAQSISLQYNATNLSRIDQPPGLIDTREKQEIINRSLRQGGRVTNFNHSFSVNYNLPFKKIPILSFIDSRVSYAGTYSYTANSLLAANLGNQLGNTSDINGNLRMNFTQLYNLNKNIRKILNPSTIKPRSETLTEKLPTENGKSNGKLKGESEISQTGKVQDPNIKKEDKAGKTTYANEVDSVKGLVKELKASLQYDKILPSVLDTMSKKSKSEIKKSDKKITKKINKLEKWLNRPEISKFKQVLVRFLLMPQNMNISYTENSSTNLPGYMSSPNYAGLNAKTFDPGTSFAVGLSPDRQWILNKANGGWISRDTLFTAFMGQTYSKNFTAALSLMPFNNVRVDLNWGQDFSRSYTSLLKDTTYSGNDYNYLSAQDMGTFSSTYIGIRTMLAKIKDASDVISPEYKQFLDNRLVIAERLSIANPYSAGVSSPEDPQFYKGYTRYNQDVLIPAFIAAYSKRNASTIPLIQNYDGGIKQNPFRYVMPLPNWKVRLTNMQQWGNLKKTFSSLTINHGYTGKLSVNGMNSNLTYLDMFSHNYPSFIDSTSGNFVPYFFVPNITTSESLNPLVGIDGTLMSGLNFAFDYKNTRTLSLSLIDFQLSESLSSEYSITLGKRWKNVRPIFGLKMSKKWKGDLNFNFGFSFRNNKQTIYKMVNIPVAQATGGQKVWGLSPNLDYIINENFTFRIYFDRRVVMPHFSSAFESHTTRGGVTLRYTFTQ